MTDNLEKKPPTGIDYYADTYWNDLPEVRAYIYQNATGDKNISWIQYLKTRYASKPFSHCLILACGNGWVERELFDNEIATQFDAFDYLDSSLDAARQQKGARPINYFKSSFSELVLEKQYDLIVNVGALHHASALDELLHKLVQAMTPEGIFVNWDYVGPNRNQYTDENLKLMIEVNESLPPKFRTKHLLRPEIDDFMRGDITEAVCSSEIIDTFARHFDIVERRNLGGGIAYQLLWNNIEAFSRDDVETKEQLEKIIRIDADLTRKKTVPSLFAFFIGEPKQKAKALEDNIHKFYVARLEAQLERQLRENDLLTQKIREIEQQQSMPEKQFVSSGKNVTLFHKLTRLFR